MRRPLDHVSIVTSNLERTGGLWEDLGFHVLPTMRHLEIGSCNRIVQFRGNYVELMGDLDRMREPYRSHHQRRCEWGDGIINLCFRSKDLEVDRQALIAAGIDMPECGNARRPVLMPDGSTAETDSLFCGPVREERPFMSPFLVVHRKPKTIYVSAYAIHPNTAMGIAGAICLSSDPQSDSAFFMKMCGGASEAIAGGVRVHVMGGATIDLLNADTCSERFGAAAPLLDQHATGYGIGLTIEVASLAACRDALAPHVRRIETDSSLLIPAEYSSGTFLHFVEG